MGGWRAGGPARPAAFRVGVLGRAGGRGVEGRMRLSKTLVDMDMADYSAALDPAYTTLEFENVQVLAMGNGRWAQGGPTCASRGQMCSGMGVGPQHSILGREENDRQWQVGPQASTGVVRWDRCVQGQWQRHSGRGEVCKGRSPAKVRPRCFCQVLLVPGNCPVCHWERGP